jgi:hypothetical protein
MTPDPLRDALEACRPHTDDLDRPEMEELRRRLARDPEMARMAARLRQLDARIMQAAADVRAPEGLGDRVLVRLAQARQTDVVDPIDIADVPATVEKPPASVDHAPADRRRLPTRRLWAVAASLAALLAVSLFGWNYFLRPVQVTPEQLAEQGMRWGQQVRRSGSWRPIASAPRQSHPVPTALLIAPRGWRPIATDLDPGGVAYDLRTAAQQAFCFVLVPRQRVEGLPALPPDPPHRDTGGWTVGSWHDQQRIYTLVVQGGTAQYRALINPQRGWVMHTPQPARLTHAAQ